MSWVEEKFVNMLAPRLQRFTKKGADTWNFRCPICGDSKKKKDRARGYLYRGKHALMYKCQNCGVGMSFRKLLETIDAELAKAYTLESFSERRVISTPPPAKIVHPIEQFYKPPFIRYDERLKSATKVSSLPASHFCKQYIVERLIPNKYHAKLFYVERFKTFVNSLVPGKFKEPIVKDHPRLIIPFIDQHEKLFGIQGRSFRKDSPAKYITIFFEQDRVRAYGLDEYDAKKHVYLFEGPIDSMFIDNALGMAGPSVDEKLAALLGQKDRATIVYDNEPRNVQIVSFMQSAVDAGWPICVWPREVKQKDVNEMVRAGKSGSDIQKIIDTHTYTGLQANIKISQWRRV